MLENITAAQLTAIDERAKQLDNGFVSFTLSRSNDLIALKQSDLILTVRYAYQRLLMIEVYDASGKLSYKRTLK